MGRISVPELLNTKVPELLPMVRTPGVHISVLIRRISLRMKHFTDSGGKIDLNRAELGSSWEAGLKERLYKNFSGRYYDLGEIELDNMIGTMDLLDTNPLSERKIRIWMKENGIGCLQGNKVVDEIKCTWLSSNHDPDGLKMWKFWTQLKSYCHMLGVNTGRLRIVFVNGDYKYGRDEAVHYRDFIRQFSEFELISNWKRMQAERDRMEREARERGYESVADEMERNISVTTPAQIWEETT